MQIMHYFLGETMFWDRPLHQQLVNAEIEIDG